MNYRFVSTHRKAEWAANARAVFFAVLSALSAFTIASAAPEFISPTIAAILSLSSIKTSLNDTVKETIKQTAGSFFGAILGILLVQVVGFNIMSIAVIVIASMLVGFLIRLQILGGLAIAATAILVSGPLFGDFQSIEQRVAGVFVGALCAFIVSWFMVPWNPQKRILDTGLRLGTEIVSLMDEMVSRYKKTAPLSARRVDTWLDRIDDIETECRLAKREAEQLKQDSRWTPFVKKQAAENVYGQLVIVKANASALKTVVLAMENAVEHQVELTSNASKRIAKLIQVARNGIHEQLQMAQQSPGAGVDADVEESIRLRRSKLADEMTHMDDTRAIMLGGTLIHEATKIKDLISGKGI